MRVLLVGNKAPWNKERSFGRSAKGCVVVATGESKKMQPSCDSQYEGHACANFRQIFFGGLLEHRR